MSTEPTKRTRNPNSPLGAGDALDRVVAIRETRAARLAKLIADFDAAELADEKAIADRVPAEQQARFDRMLAAYESAVETDAPPDPSATPDQSLSEAGKAARAAGHTGSSALIPARLLETPQQSAAVEVDHGTGTRSQRRI